MITLQVCDETGSLTNSMECNKSNSIKKLKEEIAFLHNTISDLRAKIELVEESYKILT